MGSHKDCLTALVNCTLITHPSSALEQGLERSSRAPGEPLAHPVRAQSPELPLRGLSNPTRGLQQWFIPVCAGICCSSSQSSGHSQWLPKEGHSPPDSSRAGPHPKFWAGRHQSSQPQGHCVQAAVPVCWD